VLTDSSAWLATTLAMIGDRLGLWTHLARRAGEQRGAGGRAGVDEPVRREWLHAMTAHGYLTHDTDTTRHRHRHRLLPAA